ncbi:hypothetical protein MMC07_009613, partial [Pseudocyphellaria aurata]|nr:hypothetical protein [Pseudocyphellaria aurata]
LGKKAGLEDSTQILCNIKHLLIILVQMQGHVVGDPLFLLFLSDSIELGVSGDKLDRILRAARGESLSEADEDEDDEEGSEEGGTEDGAKDGAEDEVIGDGDEVEEEE